MKRVITKDTSLFTLIPSVIEKRDLLFLLSKKELYLRYRYKTIGIFWGIFQPLVLSFIINQSLGKALQQTIPQLYSFLSLFLGFIFWTYFASTVSRMSASILLNRTLVKNAFFPHIILPLSTMSVGFVDFLIALTLGIGFALFFGLSFQYAYILFLCLVIMLLTTVGLGILFAVFYAKFVDIRELIGFFMMVLFFLTPVLYPVRILPAQWHMYMYLNPMAGVIETVKSVFSTPSIIPWTGLGISFASSIVLLGISMVIFHKMDKTISDIL